MSRSCRGCATELSVVLADLGSQPLANAFVAPSREHERDREYPLVAYVCTRCLLVQVPQVEDAEAIFSDYPYFSSYSDSWLAHSQRYAERMIDQLSLDRRSLVVEVASNDGYLLQFLKRSGIPSLGIEPAVNVAAVARERGIETWTRFFGVETAKDIAGRADLLVANNVLAHVPDLHDFVEGLRLALAPHGTLTIEVPHLLSLIDGLQWDTIYHEHLSYFSLAVIRDLLSSHGLTVTDVEELSTHGGSLRVFARHRGAAVSKRVDRVLEKERALTSLSTYTRFRDGVVRSKQALLEFLRTAKAAGHTVAAYGAPAKGNTLLNSCGVDSTLVAYTVDRNIHKQGLLLPGSRVPILAPSRLDETRPDYVLILPWNLREEIVAQNARVRTWGGRFVVPIPNLEVET